jgi:hypothetical protein
MALATDLPKLFRALELETEAGKINLATIVIVTGAFTFAAVIGALGGLADRLMYIIWLRKQPLPPGFELEPWINKKHVMREARFTLVLLIVCFVFLDVTS